MADMDLKNRKQTYKNKGKDQDACRTRRMNLSVELRKKKIEDHLLKRRHIPNDQDTEIHDDSLFENMKNLVGFEVI